VKNVIQGLARSSGQNWNALFSKYYFISRTAIYENELLFWQSICKNKSNVLEIGAGSGFISKSLLDVNIGELSLVEPELENVKYLKSLALKNDRSTVVTIIDSVFQEYSSSVKQDVIFTSWDNLSMFSNINTRRDIFNNVAKNLKPDGIFVFHLSSKKFHYEDFKRCEKPLNFQYDLNEKQKIEVRFSIEKISDIEYLKHLDLKDPDSKTWHFYILPTISIAEHEVRKLAKASGLVVVDYYNNFEKNKVENPDDYIWILKKPN
jgi:SAM-dependent methyltransferase